MPFSALSPEGPVSLLGAEAATVESLRSRNRREACFTAKCCGAPLTIRTAPGKAPHFVHKVVPRGCDGDRRETGEHRRLKELIATAAKETGAWGVETEALYRPPDKQEVLWRADVLASRRRTRVAFEVQLSNADYEAMRLRQERYRECGVRGLWFVRTKKGFPPSHELPVFVVDSDPDGDWVSLATAWDWPFTCALTRESRGMELAEFVRSALDGNLRWAPFENEPDTWLQAYVDYAASDACPNCGRTVAEPYCVRARIASVASYPEFQFAHVGGFRRSSGWYQPLVDAVWDRVQAHVDLTLRSRHDTCCRCSTPLGRGSGKPAGNTGSLVVPLQLKDLPKPRFGSVEQAWLRRWALLRPEAAPS